MRVCFWSVYEETHQIRTRSSALQRNTFEKYTFCFGLLVLAEKDVLPTKKNKEKPLLVGCFLGPVLFSVWSIFSVRSFLIELFVIVFMLFLLLFCSNNIASVSLFFFSQRTYFKLQIQPKNTATISSLSLSIRLHSNKLAVPCGFLWNNSNLAHICDLRFRSKAHPIILPIIFCPC